MSARCVEGHHEEKKQTFTLVGGLSSDPVVEHVSAAKRYVQARYTKRGEAKVSVDDLYTTVYQDAASTPHVSPDTDVGQTPVGYIAPANARWLFLYSTLALRYGTNGSLDGSTNGGYDVTLAGVWSDPIPVSPGENICIRNDATSGNATVYHRWEIKVA